MLQVYYLAIPFVFWFFFNQRSIATVLIHFLESFCDLLFDIWGINVSELILSKMSSFLSEGGTTWQCNECFYSSKFKTNVREHIEAKHVESDGFYCPQCEKICPNKKSLRNHIYKFHKQNWWGKVVSNFPILLQFNAQIKFSVK